MPPESKPRLGELDSGPRLPCQVCGRPLVPKKDGTARCHNYRSRHGRWTCQGSGYRMARWPVGQLLRHHAGDLWEVVEDRGGQWSDYYLRCLRGREEGREMVAHGEYMHRHGWEVAEASTIAVHALRARWTHEETPATVVGWIFDALDEQGDTTVPRTRQARDEAVVMAGMVFADLGPAGEGIDYFALVSNVLRATEPDPIRVEEAASV